MSDITTAPTPSYDILISEFNSGGLREWARIAGVTHMRYLGSASTDLSDNERPDSEVSLYEFSNGFQALDTNGDPVGEDEDGFSLIKSLILGEISKEEFEEAVS